MGFFLLPTPLYKLWVMVNRGWWDHQHIWSSSWTIRPTVTSSGDSTVQWLRAQADIGSNPTHSLPLQAFTSSPVKREDNTPDARLMQTEGPGCGQPSILTLSFCSIPSDRETRSGRGLERWMNLNRKEKERWFQKREKLKSRLTGRDEDSVLEEQWESTDVTEYWALSGVGGHVWGKLCQGRPQIIP